VGIKDVFMLLCAPKVFGHNDSRENANPEKNQKGRDSCWSLSRTLIRGRNDHETELDIAVDIKAANLLK